MRTGAAPQVLAGLRNLVISWYAGNWAFQRSLPYAATMPISAKLST